MVEKKFSKKEIEKSVKEIIADIVDVKKEKLTLATKLREDLAIDSLSAAEIMFSIQENFGVDIQLEKMSDFNTIGDVVKSLDDKLNG